MIIEAQARRSSQVGLNTRPDSVTHTSAELELGEQARTEKSPSADEPLTKLTPGTLIPDTRLEIVRWLGEGGMGTVFEVRHLDIDRHFAAKLLHRSESVARARRFRREAKTIGSIGSPWIVEIFDFKELPDGRLMYTMELVDGPSLLDNQRAGGPIQFARLIGLARQICKGLTDAHTRGFIHRDIKPENIMLATDASGREHVKLVDFGLAGLLAEPHESSRAGTPAYMSPEQCKGEPADARTDIYSLGITLYELGCGVLPFVQDNANAVRDDHVRKQPKPPSSVLRTLPRSFDALVLRCLAKRPEQRFANAAEVEAALIELQLELGLQTEWDDLPAPVVREPRRQQLEQGLAGLRRNRERETGARALFGIALASLVALSSALGWWVGADSRAEAAAQAKADIETLRARVLDAAADHLYVYPPPEQPDAATAYGLLVELESIEGAEDAGHQLRTMLAEELVAYGDQYWDKPGGRGFARDFYRNALAFNPDHPRALERAGLTRAAVEALRVQAASGEFEAYELEAAAPLAVLTDPDERTRLKKLVELSDRPEPLPTSVAVSIDHLIAGLGHQLPDVTSDAPEHAIGSVATGLTPIVEAEPDVEPEPDPSEPIKKTDRSAEAKRLAAEGDGAYKAGKRDEAERLYQRSLALDGNNLDALVGLHRLSFDRGHFKDALTYAKQALALRPKRGDLNLYVGDACMKVLDYDCARTHYEQANTLGNKQAAKRLRMLDERLGTPDEGDP